MKCDAPEHEVLHLPAEASARLAKRLLQSLVGISGADAEKLWLAEVTRRAQEMDAGAVEMVSAETLEDRARSLTT